MNYLTAKDMNVLNSLSVPQVQRAIIEKRWSKTKEGRKNFLITIYVTIVPLLVVSGLTASYFVEGMTPFVNVSLFAIWVFYAMVDCGLILLAFTAFEASISKDEEVKRRLLDRSFINFGLKEGGTARKFYNRLVAFILIALYASLGHFTTALFLVVSLVIIHVCKKYIRVIVEEILEELTTAQEEVTPAGSPA